MAWLVLWHSLVLWIGLFIPLMGMKLVYVIGAFKWVGLNGLPLIQFMDNDVNRGMVALSLVLICALFSATKMGDHIYRWYQGARLPTQKESEQIKPIIEALNAKAEVGLMLKTVWVVDNALPFALASAREQLLVSKGLLQTEDGELLHACMAHEFSLLMTGAATRESLMRGSRFFSFMLLVIFGYFCRFLNQFQANGFISLIFRMVAVCIGGVFKWIKAGIDYGMTYLKGKEIYEADKYVVDMGYGEPLMAYLSQCQEVDLGGHLMVNKGIPLQKRLLWIEQLLETNEPLRQL